MPGNLPRKRVVNRDNSPSEVPASPPDTGGTIDPTSSKVDGPTDILSTNPELVSLRQEMERLRREEHARQEQEELQELRHCVSRACLRSQNNSPLPPGGIHPPHVKMRMVVALCEGTGVWANGLSRGSSSGPTSISDVPFA